MRASAKSIGIAFALLSALGFSFKAIFVKLGLAAGSDAVTLLALRMGFSLPVFAFLAWRTGAGSLSRRDWLAVAGLGMLGYYLSSLFDFLGLQTISAGLERLILFSYPLLVLVFGAVFFGEAFTRRTAGALTLCYSGLALAIGHDLQVSADTRALVIGSLWVLGSATTYALYMLGSSRIVGRLGALRLTAYASSFAAFFCLAHFAATKPLAALLTSREVYAAGIALAVFSTVLPIWAQAEAIRRVGPGTTSLLATLGPILTILLGWSLLGEPLSAWQLAGAALVMTGVWIVGRK